MSFQTKEEMQTEAANRANEQIDSFPDVTRISGGSEEFRIQLESIQRFLTWAKAKLKYTEADGEKAFKELHERLWKTLYDRNLKNLMERNERWKEVEKQSWEIMEKNFAAVRIDDDKKLSLNDNIDDSISTPTILSLLRETHPCIADELVLTDRSEYLKHLIKERDDQRIDFELENKCISIRLVYRPSA